MFISSLFIVLTAYAVSVDSLPQGDIGFPEESEGPVDYDDLGNRQGFGARPRPQQGIRPQQGFGPQQRPRPQQGVRPQQGSRPQQGFRPQQGIRPGDNSRPPGFPGNNFGPSNPPGGSGTAGNGFRPLGVQPVSNTGSSGVQPGNGFRPTNSRPGNVITPVTNQRPNSNSQNGNNFTPSNTLGGNNSQNQGSQVQTPTTSSTTTASAGETTTRIPPRDPTNRIVYTVSCECQYTRQYTPVCGTDGQTYGNLGVLRCAQQCGTDVQIYLMGACVGNRGG